MFYSRDARELVAVKFEDKIKIRRYDNLDGMMASLDTDLAKKGVRVNNRGMCSACDKVIVGKVMGL